MSRRLAVLALGRPGVCTSLNPLTLAKLAALDVVTGTRARSSRG